MIIESIIFMGLDEISEQALENLRKASELLFNERRIKLIIIPLNTWQDPINSSIKSLPLIIINGLKAFSGYAPSVDEIKNFILKHIIFNRDEQIDMVLPAGLIYDNKMYGSVTT